MDPMLKEGEKQGTPGWLSQLSVRLLVSAQVMSSQLRSSSSESGSVLTVWSLLGMLSLSLSLSLSLTLPTWTVFISLEINKPRKTRN